MHLVNDSPSFTPVHSQIRAIGPQDLHLAKGRGQAGLVSLRHVALDGTKLRANASKHKAMSHERMLKSERQLEGEMRAMLLKAELIDAQEVGHYGKGKRDGELPEELQRRSSRLEWIRKAKAELETEAAAAKAAKRNEQAETTEQETDAAEASGDEPRSKRAARGSRVRESGRMTRRSSQWRRARPQA